VLPALALSVAVIVFLITTVSNQLSRRVEARADSFSLQLTHEPDAFISFQRRIALKNVSDPDPWDWTSFLFGTHPTTVDRIGTGVAAREGR
jgi:STE24 endopeptidase